MGTGKDWNRRRKAERRKPGRGPSFLEQEEPLLPPGAAPSCYLSLVQEDSGS